MSGTSKIISLNNGFHVWTRRVGESPIKMLLLHGGPGVTHEYLENFEEYLPPCGIEIYFYDQLGSYYSDQPDDSKLWNVERFREEVEEVRKGLGLEQFYLYGSSWGGMLAIKYALKYGEHLKGLVLSNTTASIEASVKHLNEIRNELPKSVLDLLEHHESLGDIQALEYEEAIFKYISQRYICRLDPWPNAINRSLKHLNTQVIHTILGTEEFEITGNLRDWNRWSSLHGIKNPTLLIGARHDTMSPEDMGKMAGCIPKSRFRICQKSSHMSMWEEPDKYFNYITNFINDVEAGKV